MKDEKITGVLVVIIGVVIFLITEFRITASTATSEVTALSPRFFPFFAAISLVILGCLITLSSFRSKKQSITIEPKVPEQKKKFKTWRVWGTILTTLAYIYLINWLGFILASVIAVGLTMFIFGERSWKTIVATSILSSVMIYYFFVKGFNIPFPAGIFIK